MKCYLLFMTVLSLLSSSAEAGKRYAVVVGVKSYRAGQPLPELPYTENDATKLAETLEAGGYQVTLMTQTVGRREGDELMNPISDFIRDQIDAVLDNPFLKDDDVVIVALAGHGVQYELTNASGKEPHFYFCPGDADIRKLSSANGITDRNRLIDMQELYTGLQKCKAGAKLLLVDACRNDPTKPSLTRSLASKTLPPLPPPPGGTAAFFSCSQHQKAFEDADLKHGVFFHHVIQALKGDADASTSKHPADGQITLTELSEHVAIETYNFVRTKFRGAKQAPELKGQFRLTVPIIEVGKKRMIDVPLKIEMQSAEGGSRNQDSILVKAKSYDLKLYEVQPPELPPGWSGPTTIATSYSDTGLPRLGSVAMGPDTAMLKGLELKDDFFVEWDLGWTSNQFRQEMNLTSKEGQHFPLILKYSSSIVAGNVELSMLGTNATRKAVGRPAVRFPMLVRLERRAGNYTLLVNCDETNACRLRGNENQLFESLSILFSNSVIHDLRSGPLVLGPPAPTSKARFRFTSSSRLPKGLLMDGKATKDTLRVASIRSELNLGREFELEWNVKRIMNYASHGVRLIGKDGGRSLPIFFDHSGGVSYHELTAAVPQASALKIHIPAKAYDLEFSLRRSGENFVLSVGPQGGLAKEIPFRGTGFGDFDQIKLEIARPGIALIAMELK